MDFADNSGVKMSMEFSLQEWGVSTLCLSHTTVDYKAGIVVHARNASTLETEAVGLL